MTEKIGHKAGRHRRLLAIPLLVLLLILVCFAALALGTTSIPLNELVRILTAALLSSQDALDPVHTILLDIRLPRIILGIAVGGSLSLAGTILQGLFRNPLVEPYTLGISGGASLGVCLSIIFSWQARFGALAYPLSGFAGALLVMSFVYGVSGFRKRMRIRDMLLIGVMISFIASSLVMLLMAVSRSEDLNSIVFWIMGSLDEPDRGLILFTTVFALVGLFCSYLFCHDLNGMALGEEEAAHLGIRVERTKRLLFLLASLLTGISVSVAGVIGFVGLVIPHFMRLLLGPDHRLLLAAAFLGGSAFLILCDTMARTIISPLELPVGVVTGIIGGTVFIFTLTRKKVTL